MKKPKDAKARCNVAPVICYPPETLPAVDLEALAQGLAACTVAATQDVAPRDASSILIPAGYFLRISCVDGPQVGDLNLFHAEDLNESFYSGKTRALHGTHVSTGDQLWSRIPFLRPMATIVEDSLAWYGADKFGGRVHDVIGTRCDPYTNRLLSGTDYHHCCHSNLTRALADVADLSLVEAERHVHDVLNVFMCTGFTRDTGQYFMKATPARAGDFLTMRAEIDLIAVLSACPGGDCGSAHSSDAAQCYPLRMECLRPNDATLAAHEEPAVNLYDRSHGTG